VASHQCAEAAGDVDLTCRKTVHAEFSWLLMSSIWSGCSMNRLLITFGGCMVRLQYEQVAYYLWRLQGARQCCRWSSAHHSRRRGQLPGPQQPWHAHWQQHCAVLWTHSEPAWDKHRSANVLLQQRQITSRNKLEWCPTLTN